MPNALGLKLIAYLGVPGLLLWIIFTSIFHIECFERLGALFARMFIWLGTSTKKAYIVRDLQWRVTKSTKLISKDSDKLMPFDLKISWVKETNQQTFLQNGQVIVRMSEKRNKTINMVYAVNEYISNGLIPKARRYIDPSIMKATDLMVARKMILTCWSDGIEYFDTEYLDKIREENSEVNELINLIVELDKTGLLYSVLLREFQKAGLKVYPAIKDECLIAESREFLRYLYEIASKQVGVDVNLDFMGAYFQVKVVIAGRKETMREVGIAPYCKRIKSGLEKGVKTIYILSSSSPPKKFIDSIVGTVKATNLRVKDDKRYSYSKMVNGKYFNGVCVALETTVAD